MFFIEKIFLTCKVDSSADYDYAGSRKCGNSFIGKS